MVCNVSVDKTNPNVAGAISGVMSALSAKKQSEVKAWEEEIRECPHAASMVSVPKADGAKVAGKLARCQALILLSVLRLLTNSWLFVSEHCNDCELKNNLWLCLTCGNVGCGRKQYDGSGGNGHGMAHYETTGHSVCVKLGTITPEGTAGGLGE